MKRGNHDLHDRTQQSDTRRQAIIVLAYFAAHFAYLFLHLETEFEHWLGLVVLPTAALLALAPQTTREYLGSVGLARGKLMRGVLIGMIVGVALGSLQLLLSRQRTEALAMIRSGEAAWAYPLAVLLMLATAGFTEEFFFRGLLLTRLLRWSRSRLLAIAASALCFGLYHLPYAFMNPRWPSHGDWGAAWLAAMGQGGVMGVVLGAIFVLSGENLLAAVLVHACFNAGWAMTMLR